jgi:hypothetical protein
MASEFFNILEMFADKNPPELTFSDGAVWMQKSRVLSHPAQFAIS